MTDRTEGDSDHDREGADPASAADRVENAVFAALESGDPEAALAESDLPPDLQTRAARILARLRREDLVADSKPPASELPERLGEFRLQRRLGAGGMGVVYVARQETLGRTVALKLIRPEHLYFPGSRERFKREVEAVAQLHHASIVTVYTAGEDQGLPYFCMEYLAGCSLAEGLEDLRATPLRDIDGRSLQAVCLRRSGDVQAMNAPPSLAGVFAATWIETCLAIATRMADALQHAHTRGILHRDVKPSNILLTPDGRARLVDFGLAWTEAAHGTTKTYSHMGSLPWAAPEHLDGAAGASPQQDVYALGVTLYEMLTLRNPFLGTTADETRRRIREGRPAAIRAANSSVSLDLETVCLTALDPDPRRRYPSASALLADLENVRHRRPIAARRPGAGLRMRRFAQRHPTAAAASAVAVVLLVIGAFLYALAEGRARRHADTLTAQARTEAYAAGVQTAGYALLGSIADPPNARERLAACPSDLRQWEWRHLALRADEAIARVRTGVSLRNVRFTPDGNRLVLVGVESLIIVDVPSGTVVRRLEGLRNSTGCFALSGDALAHGDGDGNIVIRGWPDLGVRQTLSDPSVHARPVTVLLFGRGGALYSGGGEGNVVRWRLPGGEPRLLHRHADVVRALAVSPDDARLASGSIDRRAVCFDLATDAIAWERRHDGWVLDVTFDPRQEALLTCDSRLLRVFGADGTLRAAITRNFDRITFSADGSHLLGLFNRSRLAMVRLSDDMRLTEVASLCADETTHAIAFSPTGLRVVAVDEAGQAQIWDPLRRGAQRRVLGHARAVSSVAVLDRSFAISADSGGQVRVLDCEAGTSHPVSRPHRERVCALAASADGQTFLSAGEDGELWLWDATSQTVRIEFDTAGDRLSRAALDATGRHVVAGTPDGVLRQWRADDGSLVRRWKGHAEFVTALAFHPRADRFAAADETGTVVEWDVISGAAVRRLAPENHAWISALAYARDGSWLATAAADCSIRVYQDGQTAPRLLIGHNRTPSALAATGDGRLLSSGGFEFSLRVWDIESARCLLNLIPSTAILAMDSQGERVVTGHLSGYLQIWDTAVALDATALAADAPRLDELTPPPSGRATTRHR